MGYDKDMEEKTIATCEKPGTIVDFDHLRHPEEFKAFSLWLSLPSFMRRPPKAKDGTVPTVRDFAEKMGFDDEEAIAFLEIKTMQEFAEKYNVHPNTLTAWKKAVRKADPFSDIREWANDLNRNVIFSLYNKAIQGGLPEHYKLWFQVVAGWSEKVQHDHRVIRTVNLRVLEAPQHVDATVIPAPEEPATVIPAEPVAAPAT